LVEQYLSYGRSLDYQKHFTLKTKGLKKHAKKDIGIETKYRLNTCTFYLYAIFDFSLV